jgi:hypothetical protein
VSDTSFGQAWINFVHHPAGGVLRVLGVVALAFAAYAVVSMTHRPRTTEGDRPPGREVFVG